MGTVKVPFELILVQNNEQFSMWDSIDGVISLAWESIDVDGEYPNPRLVFRFGMKFSDVKATLYERDIIMECEEVKTK